MIFDPDMKKLIFALQECETEKAIDQVFADFEISDIFKKTDCLLKAMGDQRPFDTSFLTEHLNPKDKYEHILKKFLFGAWALRYQGLPGNEHVLVRRGIIAYQRMKERRKFA
jgi:hypothetical protein